MEDVEEVNGWNEREDLGSKQRKTCIFRDVIGESLHQLRIAYREQAQKYFQSMFRYLFTRRVQFAF